jgi:hypothetical protein
MDHSKVMTLTNRFVKLFLVPLRRGKQTAYKYLIPIIEERRKQELEQGKDFKRPVSERWMALISE